MTVWGDWVKNSWNFRAGIDARQTGSDDQHVYFAIDGYSQSTQTVINYGRSVLQWSEDGDPEWHDLANVYPSALGYGQTAHNSSATDSFQRYYGRTRTAQYRHWFRSPGSSDSAYQAGGYARQDFTIPARPYALPRPPRSAAVAYASDSSVTVGWQPDYDGTYDAQPWTGVNVYRSVDGGAFSKVATVGWDVTSWADAATSANHSYAYQVASYNSTGESSRVSCGTVRTTPAAPLSVVATRVSDSSQKVTWQLPSNAASSWEAVEVQRSDDGAEWKSLARISGTPANYTDTSTEANHAYAYRVRADNAQSSSGWVQSSTVWTTPRAPSKVTAAATGPTSVSVSATGLSAIAEAFEVGHRAGASGEWEAAERFGSLPATMASVAGENSYRVRAVRGSLASAWTESSAVTTVALPKAPTLTGLSARYATGSTAYVRWSANHPDGSAQVAAQAESTAPDGTKLTVDVDGGLAVAAVGPLAKGTWSVRVRTKGVWAEGDGWGEWSEPSEFEVCDLPKVALTSPGKAVDRMPIAVAWEASDATGVANQHVAIRDAAGAVVFSASVSGAERSISVTAADFLPVNGASYSVTVTVTGGSSLSASVSATFKVEWNSPSTPTADLRVTGGLAVRVRVAFGTAEGLPATDYVSLWRDCGGETVMLADRMADGEEAIDYLPPLNADFSYVLVAHSESTSQTRGVAACRVDSGGMEAFSFGADASRCVLLGLSADVSDSVAHTGETFRFALGEDAPNLPTFYPDGGTSATGTRSYDMVRLSEYRALLAVVRDPSCAVCWYRDHWGGRHRVMATWQTSYSSSSYSLWRATASVTEVAWEEPNHG